MRAVLIFYFLTLGVRAFAAFDVFLQVTPNVAGEATDPIYSGWIKVLSFESGLTKPVTASGPTGQTALVPITIVKTVDSATATFFGQLAAGTSLSTIKLVIVLQAPLRVETWDINCKTCFFTGQSFTGEEDAEVAERLSFAVGELEWSYIQLAPSGDPLLEIFAKWNQINATGSNGTRTPDYLGAKDSDKDDIPDGWLAWFFGHVNGQASDKSRARDDADGDGLDTLHEFIAHTNPRQPQSTLRVTGIQRASPNNYTLTWLSVVGLNYRIDSAPAPSGPWTFVRNVASSGNGTTSTVVAGAPPQMFYRVSTP